MAEKEPRTTPQTTKIIQVMRIDRKTEKRKLELITNAYRTK